MKRPQYVFRPNLNDPQHRRAWALLQQVPPAKRKEFLVQSILAAEQTDRLEKSIRKVVREELQAVNISCARMDGFFCFCVVFRVCLGFLASALAASATSKREICSPAFALASSSSIDGALFIMPSIML